MLVQKKNVNFYKLKCAVYTSIKNDWWIMNYNLPSSSRPPSIFENLFKAL